MARNRGDSRKVEVEPELLACDLIKRVCVLMNIQSEPRMFLRLPDSSEVGGDDVVGSFVRYDELYIIVQAQIHTTTRPEW